MMSKLKYLSFALVWLFAEGAFAQDSTYAFSLEDAKKYALEHAYQIRLAKLDVEQADSKVNETISSGLPQVSGKVDYLNNIDIPPVGLPGSFAGLPDDEIAAVPFGVDQTMTASVTANQLIFDGSYLVGLQATKIYLDISKIDLEKSAIEIKNLVTQAYGNVLVAEKNASIFKKNQANLDKQSFETEEYYKNGLREEQDRDQIKLTLQSITNEYENSVRQLENAKNKLKLVLGLPIESQITLSDDLLTITNKASDESFASKEFDINAHIDYKSILIKEKSSELLLKQKKSEYLPKVTGFYTFQRNSFANEFNFFGSSSQWNSGQFFGLNLNVPIFTSFASKNKVQQAKIDLQKDEITKMQVADNLKVEAENAKSNYLFALNQYKTSNENLALAERIYDKVKAKYDEGINSSLELTNANNQLLEIQGKYIQASYALIDAKVKLDKALNNY